MTSACSGRFSMAHLCAGLFLVQAARGLAQPPASVPAPAAVLVEFRGSGVEVSRQPGVWDPARTNQTLFGGNLLRTDAHSQALLRFSDLETVRVAERSSLRIAEPVREKRGLEFLKGLLYFFHRDKPNEFEVRTPQMSAIIRGTEFTLEVAQDGTSTLSLLAGEAALSNPLGQIELKTGEQGIAAPGQAPRRTAMLEAANLIQWCLYYPAVLDLQELSFTDAEREALAPSRAAYQQGDLVAALAAYPKEREPASDPEHLYLAALRLSFGQVREAEKLLDAVGASGLGEALRALIAAVQSKPGPPTLNPQRSTCSLAESYWQQSQANLPATLAAARKAAELSPNFSFAWARVAELEFSFGRTKPARAAVEESLRLAPRNAQAHALHGFLLAAENRLHAALDAFDQAIAIDPMLANGWLGRGLCRIKRGDAEGGRQDLQMAALVEPNRALLRSYLGKAFSNAGDNPHATKELDRAKELDPKDPTAWFYGALLRQQENQINEGICDLEHSEELNKNRRIYRSRLLLDEDLAVRSANLASIYRDAGMTDVSAREASRAVTADYANYSAHLFLANSYNELRDPSLVNLRYETATFSEYLLANLLSPVGGTGLSPYVSQQEYSRLFEQNRLGLSSETDYSSRGDWQQQVSQFGWFADSAYAVDVFYRSLNGQRPNNDLDQLAVSTQVKQQLTPFDSVYVQAVFDHVDSGDVRQFYDPNDASRTLRTTEKQDPNLFLGYHHEWSPGIHTLLLGGWLNDDFHLSEGTTQIPGVIRTGSGEVAYTAPQICGPGADTWGSLSFQSKFEAYSAELLQLAQISEHTLIFGSRYQAGWTETRAEESRPRGDCVVPFVLGQNATNFVSAQATATDLTRLSVYGYDQWQAFEAVWLTAGLSYDHLRYPRNGDSPPVSAAEATSERISPKAGLIWMPFPSTVVRGAYTKSLGGLFYDASVRLEPPQVAGFNQAYRSLIPESIAGNIAGSRFETADVGLEQKLGSRTYLVLGAELLKSQANRDVGAFDVDGNSASDPTPSHLAETLKYEEHSFLASLNQLLSREWALGARYKLSEVELKTAFPDVSSSLIPPTDTRALLHSLDLFAIYNHPTGLFVEGQAVWTAQSNHGYSPALPGDEFWQVNLFAGFRFPHRRAQITVGLLNLSDQNYRLNPLNLYAELPRERTLTVSLKLNF